MERGNLKKKNGKMKTDGDIVKRGKATSILERRNLRYKRSCKIKWMIPRKEGVRRRIMER